MSILGQPLRPRARAGAAGPRADPRRHGRLLRGVGLVGTLRREAAFFPSCSRSQQTPPRADVDSAEHGPAAALLLSSPRSSAALDRPPPTRAYAAAPKEKEAAQIRNGGCPARAYGAAPKKGCPKIVDSRLPRFRSQGKYGVSHNKKRSGSWHRSSDIASWVQCSKTASLSPLWREVQHQPVSFVV